MPLKRAVGARGNARYLFQKLAVNDLETVASFCEQTFELVRLKSNEELILGDRMQEVTFQATHPDGAELTLVHWPDRPPVTTGASIVGFTTTDLAALVDRAEAAGGRLGEPIIRLDDERLSVALLLDPEGNIYEVVELDPGAWEVSR